MVQDTQSNNTTHQACSCRFVVLLLRGIVATRLVNCFIAILKGPLSKGSAVACIATMLLYDFIALLPLFLASYDPSPVIYPIAFSVPFPAKSPAYERFEIRTRTLDDMTNGKTNPKARAEAQ
jgi:hypothetical protein